MSRWKFSTILTLAAALGALGCGGSSSSTVAIYDFADHRQRDYQ